MSRQRERLQDPNDGRRRAARKWVGERAHNLKLDDDMIERFCEETAAGLPPETTADLLGISPKTFDQWRSKARAFDEDEGEPAGHRLYARFDMAFRLARATFLRGLVREALDAKTKPFRARLLLEVLRRRDRANWSAPREAVELPAQEWTDGGLPDPRYL